MEAREKKFHENLTHEQIEEVERTLNGLGEDSAKEFGLWLFEANQVFNNYSRHVYGNELFGLPVCIEDSALKDLESEGEITLENAVKILGGELSALCHMAKETPVDLRYNKGQLLKLAGHLEKFLHHILEQECIIVKSMSQLSVEMLTSRTKTCLMNTITILTKLYRSFQTPVLASISKQTSSFSSPLKMAYIPHSESTKGGNVRKLGETSLPSTPLEKTQPKQPRTEAHISPETNKEGEIQVPNDESSEIDDLASIATALSLSGGKKEFAANHRKFDEILTRHMKESNSCFFCPYQTKEYKPSNIFRHMHLNCQKIKQLVQSSGSVVSTTFADKSQLAMRRMNTVRVTRKE